MHQDNIGFALLREVGFSNSEAAAFSRYLRGSHLNLYRQKGTPKRRQGHGLSGVIAVLVTVSGCSTQRKQPGQSWGQLP